jgi:hypothetical protein
MNNTHHMKYLATIVATALLVSTGLSGARQQPAKNTESDLIAFSRIDKAWVHSKGANVTVAVIDWLFDPRAEAAASFVSATSMVPGERIDGQEPGHGAWMVNVVHRVAPEARIIPILAKGLTQRDYQAALVQGIRYAAEHGAVAVINSMGPVISSQALRDAVDVAEQRGTMFVDVHPETVAAGAPRPCRGSECDRRIVHTGVVSVPEHPVKPESSRDVYTWPYSLEATFADDWGFSVGPPIVAGVIALVKSANPRLSPQQIRELLVQTAYDRDGFKVLDAEAVVKAAIRVAGL